MSKLMLNFWFRKEGDIVGELGALGFSNCKFWFGKTGYHPLYEVVKKEALSMDYKTDDKLIQDFMGYISKNDWNPDIFSDLCASALKTKDQNLIGFCNELSGKEWQILMDSCNSNANPENSVLIA